MINLKLTNRWHVINDDGSNDYKRCDLDFPSSYVKDKVGRRLKEIGVDICRSYEQDSVLLGKLYERGVLTDLFVPGGTIEIHDKEYPIESTEPFTSKQTISSIKHNCVHFPLEPTKKGRDRFCYATFFISIYYISKP